MTQPLHLATLEDTSRLARAIATRLDADSIVTLSGDLGAGKTTLASTIIQHLCGADTVVTSPTFTLIQPYESEQCPIYHADLYRLESPEECYNLGLDDLFGSGICLIEWPEKAEGFLPTPSLHITLSYGADGIRHAVLASTNDLATQITADFTT